MLLEAEEKLSQSETQKKKGRMDSPHTVAQGMLYELAGVMNSF